MRTSY